MYRGTDSEEIIQVWKKDGTRCHRVLIICKINSFTFIFFLFYSNSSSSQQSLINYKPLGVIKKLNLWTQNQSSVYLSSSTLKLAFVWCNIFVNYLWFNLWFLQLVNGCWQSSQVQKILDSLDTSCISVNH